MNSTIEIINNTRGGIEGKIGERDDWGANSSPGCSFTHFSTVFRSKNIENIIPDCIK